MEEPSLSQASYVPFQPIPTPTMDVEQLTTPTPRPPPPCPPTARAPADHQLYRVHHPRALDQVLGQRLAVGRSGGCGRTCRRRRIRLLHLPRQSAPRRSARRSAPAGSAAADAHNAAKRLCASHAAVSSPAVRAAAGQRVHPAHTLAAQGNPSAGPAGHAGVYQPSRAAARKAPPPAVSKASA